ncbi:RNA-binding protein [Ordospora colligata]|nr:RNA-binding protein [Ordospora colligata]
MLEMVKNVFPGDEVCSAKSKALGCSQGKAIVAGSVCNVSGHVFVLSKTNRYQPCIDDIVIGKVTFVNQDTYKVDLNGISAVLPALSFCNTTKRNKPEISKGDYVLCKIVKTGVEPLLTCVGDGFGKLSDIVVPLEPWRIRQLYMDDTLSRIGKKFKFRIALGLNGMLWIDCERPTDTREIIHLINTSQYSFLDKKHSYK